jgi:hypothetical protein
VAGTWGWRSGPADAVAGLALLPEEAAVPRRAEAFQQSAITSPLWHYLALSDGVLSSPTSDRHWHIGTKDE